MRQVRAIAISAAVGLTGCGPASLTGTSQPRNYAPRFIESSVRPPPVAPLQLGEGCTAPSFTASVEDPNPEDLIRNRWWVDPDERYTRQFSEGTTLPSSGSERRTTAVTIPAALLAPGSPLRAAGEHRLVVVIADAEFGEGAAPLASGGTVAEPAYATSFSWTLTTDLTPCGK